MLSQAPCVGVRLATIGAYMLRPGPSFCMSSPNLQVQLKPLNKSMLLQRCQLLVLSDAA